MIQHTKEREKETTMTLIGTIIDADYVRSKNPGKAKVTQADLAAAALQAQSDHVADARDAVNAYKEEYGDGVSTLVMVYNASGAPMTFRSNNDSSGHIGKYPYDGTIQNGQWSVFLHTKTAGTATGSIAAVGYDIQDGGANPSGTPPVAVLVWNNPYSGTETAFGDVWSSGGYADTQWSSIIGYGENGGSNGTGQKFGKYGYSAPYNIGSESSPIVQFSVQKNT
jgi:hypothetical protein